MESRLNVKSSCKKRRSYFRVLDSDEEIGSTDQKADKIRSSEPKKDGEKPRENWIVESECDYDDPKLNNAHPITHYEESDYEAASDDGRSEAKKDPRQNWRGGYDLEESECDYDYDRDYLTQRHKSCDYGRYSWEAECDYGFANPTKSLLGSSPSSGEKLMKNPTTAEEINSINQNIAGLGFREQQSEPLIPAVWAGGFTVSNRQNARSTLQGLSACLSSKACTAARLAVEQLPPSIQWEKLPRCCVWPKTFQQGLGPTAHDIAVFFFPSLTKHDAAYDSLLFYLIRHDMALRTSVMGSEAELLLFTSIELPPLSTRFQGKLYLWGVFRGNQYQPRL